MMSRRRNYCGRSTAVDNENRASRWLFGKWRQPGVEHRKPRFSFPTAVAMRISLQWAIGGGVLINVPVQLLVEGDVVVLRPGHQVPGRCSVITKSTLAKPQRRQSRAKTAGVPGSGVDGSACRRLLRNAGASSSPGKLCQWGWRRSATAVDVSGSTSPARGLLLSQPCETPLPRRRAACANLCGPPPKLVEAPPQSNFRAAASSCRLPRPDSYWSLRAGLPPGHEPATAPPQLSGPGSAPWCRDCSTRSRDRRSRPASPPTTDPSVSTFAFDGALSSSAVKGSAGSRARPRSSTEDASSAGESPWLGRYLLVRAFARGFSRARRTSGRSAGFASDVGGARVHAGVGWYSRGSLCL
ncbi:hypothetical protein ISCGN_000806 [Ixodes scapularis]